MRRGGFVTNNAQLEENVRIEPLSVLGDTLTLGRLNWLRGCQCNPMQSYPSLNPLKSMGSDWRNSTQDCTVSYKTVKSLAQILLLP